VTPIRIALALATGILGVARPADAAVLCRTRARTVVERTACRPRETPIPRAALDVEPPAEGPGGAAGPAGASGRQAASLFDAAGTRIGPVVWLFELPANAGPSVAIAFALLDHQAVGGPAVLGIDDTGAGAGVVAYPGPGCTGTALVPGGTLLPMLQIVHDAVFYPTAAAPPTVLRSIERTDQSGGCATITAHGGCCVDQPGQVPVTGFATAERTTLGALGLQTPFVARAE